MITDLHFGEYLDSIKFIDFCKEIHKLSPKVVLIGGDFVQWDPSIAEELTKGLKELGSKYLCVGVLGNHDFYGGDSEKIAQAIEDAGVKLLRSDWVETPAGWAICGVDDFVGAKLAPGEFERRHGTLSSRAEVLDRLISQMPANRPKALLHHNPQIQSWIKTRASTANVKIMLAGHTHGGQIEFNFGWGRFSKRIILSRFFYEWDKGPYFEPCSKVWIFTSVGLGVAGPEMRAGALREIAVIDMPDLRSTGAFHARGWNLELMEGEKKQ